MTPLQRAETVVDELAKALGFTKIPDSRRELLAQALADLAGPYCHEIDCREQHGLTACASCGLTFCLAHGNELTTAAGASEFFCLDCQPE